MRYRAILIDPGNAAAERPTEIFSQSRTEIDRWATLVLAAVQPRQAMVKVYEYVETEIATIRQPEE